ncbi:TPA: hypothetical protein ACH3X2_014211 [Trebouxia sp. C0005]
MAIGKSPPRNRKAAARPQDHAPASLAASRSRAAPRLAAPKSKGRNSKSTNASPLTVDIPTTPFLANFLSPLDVAATQQEGLQRGSKSPRSTATSPKRSVREVTVPRSPKVESQLYTSWTPLQSPNAASPTKLGTECSGPRAVAGKLAKQQRKALVLQQILQEQQALLLEDSPAYLAALSQDNKAGFLLNSAEAHDWQLQGLGSDELARQTTRKISAAATGIQLSRCVDRGFKIKMCSDTQTKKHFKYADTKVGKHICCPHPHAFCTLQAFIVTASFLSSHFACSSCIVLWQLGDYNITWDRLLQCSEWL